MRVLRIALMLALAACGAGSAHAWQRLVPLGEIDRIGIPAVARGRLFVPLTLHSYGDGKYFVVMGASTTDGAPLWEIAIDPDIHRTGAAVVAVADRRGDVVAGGYTGDYDGGSFHRLTVVKLDGATGAVRWRPDLGIGIAWNVALDRHGDVVVLARETARDVARVFKLDGATGTLRWDVTTTAMVAGPHPVLVVDRRGDVTFGARDGVRRFSGADGALQWFVEGAPVEALVPSAAGGVTVLEGATTRDLARRDRFGREVWRRPSDAWPTLLRANRRGDVVTVELPPMASPNAPRPFTVSWIDHRTGTTVWEHAGAGSYATPVVDVVLSRHHDVTLFGWSDYVGCVRSVDARSGATAWEDLATFEGNPARVIVEGHRVLSVSDSGIGVTIAGIDTALDPTAPKWGRCRWGDR